MKPRSTVRVTVRWSRSSSSGRFDKDIDIDTHPDACEKQVWQIVWEAVTPWMYEEYEVHMVEESPNIEFELSLKETDSMSVAQDFVDDIAETLTIYRG